MPKPAIFLVTGCSSGFGSALVQKCLDAGDKVAATSRSPSSLRFTGADSANYQPLALDVTDNESIEAAFAQTVAKFGRVDVVVNNAGYGLAGAFEELSDADVQKIMDVNFMGVVKVTRVALRYMREVNKPSGGIIQQITSIGGQLGMPLVSAYCASKWAVEGFTESLAKELKPEWNISLSLIEPGGFRTEWAHNNMAYRDAARALPAYDHMSAEKVIPAMAKAQIGDPIKGAAAIHTLAHVESPPLRCLLGSEAFEAMGFKLKDYEEKYKLYEDIALPVDVDGERVNKS